MSSGAIPPTPWCFRDDLLDEYLNPCVVDAHGEPVCSVDDHDDGSVGKTGRLIASAPALRRALSAIFADCHDQTTPSIREMCKAALGSNHADDARRMIMSATKKLARGDQ